MQDELEHFLSRVTPDFKALVPELDKRGVKVFLQASIPRGLNPSIPRGLNPSIEMNFLHLLPAEMY